MGANTAPIYPRSPRNPSALINSAINALTRTDGVGTIGTDLVLLDTAGPEGTFYRSVLVKPCGSAGGNSSATVIRLFLSSQSSGATTAANTQLIGEVQIPSVAVANATIPTPDFAIPLNIAVGPGESLLVGTSVATGANVSFGCVAMAGDY